MSLANELTFTQQEQKSGGQEASIADTDEMNMVDFVFGISVYCWSGHQASPLHEYNAESRLARTRPKDGGSDTLKSYMFGHTYRQSDPPLDRKGRRIQDLALFYGRDPSITAEIAAVRLSKNPRVGLAYCRRPVCLMQRHPEDQTWGRPIWSAPVGESWCKAHATV
jgi:hypothetical protein